MSKLYNTENSVDQLRKSAAERAQVANTAAAEIATQQIRILEQVNGSLERVGSETGRLYSVLTQVDEALREETTSRTILAASLRRYSRSMTVASFFFGLSGVILVGLYLREVGIVDDRFLLSKLNLGNKSVDSTPATDDPLPWTKSEVQAKPFPGWWETAEKADKQPTSASPSAKPVEPAVGAADMKTSPNNQTVTEKRPPVPVSKAPSVVETKTVPEAPKLENSDVAKPTSVTDKASSMTFKTAPEGAAEDKPTPSLYEEDEDAQENADEPKVPSIGTAAVPSIKKQNPQPAPQGIQPVPIIPGEWIKPVAPLSRSEQPAKAPASGITASGDLSSVAPVRSEGLNQTARQMQSEPILELTDIGLTSAEMGVLTIDAGKGSLDAIADQSEGTNIGVLQVGPKSGTRSSPSLGGDSDDSVSN